MCMVEHTIHGLLINQIHTSDYSTMKKAVGKFLVFLHSVEFCYHSEFKA